MDDDELLRGCQRGDDSALTLLVQRFQDRVFRLAYRVLGDAARAEDATADAMAIVWARCRSWRGQSSAGTWIHRVALRVVLDHARSRRRWWRFWSLEDAEAGLIQSDGDPATAILDEMEATNQQQKLVQVLGQLAADDRALVHLHYFEDQSLAEIAAMTGVSREALKMRLSRCRQKLRRLLGDNDDHS